MSDLISRMDAIQACQVGPSDEWAKATKGGYTQAATDCARNILRIEPQPDPRDAVIAQLVEAAKPFAQVKIKGGVSQAGDIGRTDVTNIRAALAAARSVQP